MAAPAMAAPTASKKRTYRENHASSGKASFPIQVKYVNKYNLGKKGELREIAAAKVWAKGSKPRSVRSCESGGNYGINTGNGYYGAYQFAAGTWRGVGGGRYSSYAHQAPKFAQDHMAYRLWKRRRFGPLGLRLILNHPNSRLPFEGPGVRPFLGGADPAARSPQPAARRRPR